MAIVIRDIHQQDQSRWLALWQGYTEFYDSPQPADVTAFTWQRLFDPASALFARVAEVDGYVVGFAICVLHEGTWVKTPICYLEDLFVDPQFRGRGIARTLMQAILAESKEQGWARLYWNTRTNNPARRLYDEFTPADDYVRYSVKL